MGLRTYLKYLISQKWVVELSILFLFCKNQTVYYFFKYGNLVIRYLKKFYWEISKCSWAFPSKQHKNHPPFPWLLIDFIYVFSSSVIVRRRSEERILVQELVSQTPLQPVRRSDQQVWKYSAASGTSHCKVIQTTPLSFLKLSPLLKIK